MARSRLFRRSPQSLTVLWVALGTAAGVALGLVIADRLGSARAERRQSARERAREWAEDLDEAPFDHLPDDEGELSPESIDYVHASDLTMTPAYGMAAVGTARSVPTIPVAHDELEARVLEAFRNDPTLAARAIDIGAIGPGIIELAGWVQAPSETDYALVLARGVPGVAGVVNRLAVRISRQG